MQMFLLTGGNPVTLGELDAISQTGLDKPPMTCQSPKQYIMAGDSSIRYHHGLNILVNNSSSVHCYLIPLNTFKCMDRQKALHRMHSYISI